MVAPAIPVASIALPATGFAFSGIVSAIKGLYGVVRDINDFLNDHIEEMKKHENPTIARTGRVLEMAKLGFGIGYATPVVVIAVGQYLLGNTLAAVATVATAATLTNPIAMTCAAVGAIYYGWGALSDVERDEILEKLSKGLEIGCELIKSIVRFVLDKTKEILSSKNIEEFKKFIGSAAAVFGKTLGDVTHRITDIVSDSVDTVKKKSGEALDKTVDVASDAYRTVGKAAETIKDKLSRSIEPPVMKD